MNSSKTLLCLIAFTTFTTEVEALDANNNPLIGCWRSQYIEQKMPTRVLNLNSDCVGEFSETKYRSRCHYQKQGDKSYLYTYRATPEKIIFTMIEAPTGEPLSPNPREVNYSIVKGKWLITSFIPPQIPKNSNREIPDKITYLSIKEDITNEQGNTCLPRRQLNNQNRVTQTPASSILLTAPPGFSPVLTDLYAEPDYAQLIGSNFLIGMFSKHASSPSKPLSDIVIALEDYKSGPKPITTEEFNTLKNQLKIELGEKTVSCENSTSICFDREMKQSSEALKVHMTTMFFNIKGRVVILYSTAADRTERAKQLSMQNAAAFADALVKSNP